MGRVANPELASLWRERLERQRRSGLSILEYCRREGCSAGNFHAWKRRLRASPATVERKPKARASRDQAPRGGFVQFPLVVESTIEVRFGDGTLLRLPAENLAALAVTVRTLRASLAEGGADD
jgi:hypothetical protein